jgi:hypothetical protein
MPATRADFEGLVASDSVDGVPDGYAGLNWGIGVVGRDYVETNFPTLTDGYDNVMRGDACAFTVSNDEQNTTKATFTAVEGTFTLVSGIFAAAWNTGQTVKFTAYADGQKVGSQTAVMDQTAQEIVFDRGFRHIDTIKIKGFGGTDANPDDEEDFGFGAHIAMDNLKLKLDEAAPAPDFDHDVSAYDFAILHSQDWLCAL